MNMFSCTIQQLRLLKSSTLLCIVCIGSIVASAHATPPLPPELHQEILSIIGQVFSDDYKTAEDEARRLTRKFPESPAGYFCMAFVLDSWMVKYQSDKKEDEFYRYCDLAIEKGEKELSQNGKNEWAKFFIAASDGFKGTYEARYERWITAFRLGWKGVSVLLDLASDGCGIPDIHYGIASYNYWRGALTKMLWWMPGIEDKREEAIITLFKVCGDAVYTGDIASGTLVEILLNEKRYAEALTLAEKQLLKHPNYMPFLTAKAKSLVGLQQHDEAVACLKTVLERYTLYLPNNHYQEVVFGLLLAKEYYLQKKYSLSVAECVTIKNITLEGTVKKRLEPFFSELKALEKLIIKEQAALRQ